MLMLWLILLLVQVVDNAYICVDDVVGGTDRDEVDNDE